tara:strand:- start:273 stop:551 length:279 start_codon:yes stop_codon:yes gene_type:complete
MGKKVRLVRMRLLVVAMIKGVLLMRMVSLHVLIHFLRAIIIIFVEVILQGLFYVRLMVINIVVRRIDLIVILDQMEGMDVVHLNTCVVVSLY